MKNWWEDFIDEAQALPEPLSMEEWAVLRAYLGDEEAVEAVVDTYSYTVDMTDDDAVQAFIDKWL